MDSQDFQDNRDNMVGTDFLEKGEIPAPPGIMKTLSQVIKGFLARRGPPAEQDLEDNEVWEFPAHRERGGPQELQAAPARGASRA